MKQKFNITGMSCASCQAHVQKSVSKLDGMRSANVNLLSKSMVVDYDESKLDAAKIAAAVTDAGYGAAPVEEDAQKKNANPR